MIEMCDLLLKHASDTNRLVGDPVVQAAAQRWIEVLGEAATRVSAKTRDSHPEVAWRELTGMRVILAHGYFHIEQDVVAVVIARDVPLLRAQLKPIADSLASSERD